MKDVKDFIQNRLMDRLSDVLAESKGASSWWDALEVSDKKKVVDILGLSKGKDKASFSKLDDDEQSEITAYFRKHKGVVEGLN
jgi:hypothetical protein